MGYISDIYEIDNLINHYNSFPIISCISLESMKNKFKCYKELSLGELLSAEQIKTHKDKRNSVVAKTVEEIISKINANKIIITGIDILFNPEYKLDILKLFIQLSRNRSLIIQWPGKFDGESLIYSEVEFIDYRKYLIKDYDVICLK